MTVTVWFPTSVNKGIYPMVMIERREQRFHYRVSGASLRRLTNLLPCPLAGRITIHSDGWTITSAEIK